MTGPADAASLSAFPDEDPPGSPEWCQKLLDAAEAEEIIQEMMPPYTSTGARRVQRWREDVLLAVVVRALVWMRDTEGQAFTLQHVLRGLHLPMLKGLSVDLRLPAELAMEIHGYLAELQDPSCRTVIAVGKRGGYPLVSFLSGDSDHYHHVSVLHGRVVDGVLARIAQGRCAAR